MLQIDAGKKQAVAFGTHSNLISDKIQPGHQSVNTFKSFA